MDETIDPLRIEARNDAPIDPEGRYVLYWMIASRRLRDNFALQRAIARAEELGKPLLIFEPLRLGYRWSSPRIHRFVLDGMAEHAAELADHCVGYYPYVETEAGQGKGLLAALAGQAAVVVADDYPAFFLPDMIEAAAETIGRRLEVVDSNGVLPMRLAEKTFLRAYDFRRFLQREGRDYLDHGCFPDEDPLQGLELERFAPSSIEAITARWPIAQGAWLEQGASLPAWAFARPNIGIVAERPGGSQEAERRLRVWVEEGLQRYADDRNHPDQDASSGLSPYLHFGALGSHRILRALFERDDWSAAQLGDQRRGSREGFWNTSDEVASFLDELITWRELGFNMAHREPQSYTSFESLPDWARATLEEHRDDPRDPCYELETLEAAQSHDPIWNAAQRQLREQGIIHNYLRMLWGKHILGWSESPERALEVMIELNNAYALDGRDPNSYSGIFWVLGRYDRAWQERPIYGKLRYMSSASTRRKLKLKRYLDRWGPAQDEEPEG